MAGALGAGPEEDRRRVLDRHLAALDGPLAGERIVKVLEEAGYLAAPPPPAPAADVVRGLLHNKVRTLSKKINMRRPGHRNNLKYHAHRFPGVTATELEAAAARLGALLGRNFADLRITRMQEHIFRIES
jgi:hypothetical protein